MKTPTYYYKNIGTKVPADHPVRKIMEVALWELKQRFHPNKTVKCMLFTDANPNDYDFKKSIYLNGFYRTGTDHIKVKMKKSIFSQLATLAHEIRHFTQWDEFEDPTKTHLNIEKEADRFGQDFALDFTEEHEELFEAAQKALEKWMEEHPPSEYNMELKRKIKREEALPLDASEYPEFGGSLMI